MSFKEFLNKELYVHIDDERPPKNQDALWLKSYQDALNWVDSLKPESIIKRVNFDNDIGDTAPGHDGYDILKRLLEKVSDGMNMPKEIMIHTQNSINRSAMINYIKSFCRFTNTSFSTYNEQYMVENLLVDGIVFVFSELPNP